MSVFRWALSVTALYSGQLRAEGPCIWSRMLLGSTHEYVYRVQGTLRGLDGVDISPLDGYRALLERTGTGTAWRYFVTHAHPPKTQPTRASRRECKLSPRPPELCDRHGRSQPSVINDGLLIIVSQHLSIILASRKPAISDPQRWSPGCPGSIFATRWRSEGRTSSALAGTMQLVPSMHRYLTSTSTSTHDTSETKRREESLSFEVSKDNYQLDERKTLRIKTSSSIQLRTSCMV